LRFIPTRVHGVIDYLWGIALAASPWLFGYATGGAAQWVAIAFGIAAVLYSLATVYELGAVRVIPMSMHLALDGFAGAVLAASPWLFGFSGQVFWPHLAFGLFSVLASLVSQTRASLHPALGHAGA
jgi:hypothetical protein